MEKIGNYELLYIVHPDLESSIDSITDRVRGYIENRSGKINYEENWGKRKLAYEVKKADVGIYILWYFSAPQKSIAKIEKDIRLTEEIIRYLILAVVEKKRVEKKRATKEVSPEVEVKKKAIKKESPKKESESARMKKIDEKLEALLKEEK